MHNTDYAHAASYAVHLEKEEGRTLRAMLRGMRAVVKSLRRGVQSVLRDKDCSSNKMVIGVCITYALSGERMTRSGAPLKPHAGFSWANSDRNNQK